MGLWERMNNPDFNLTGFREVKMLNMESINALLIQQRLTQGERLVQLNSVAITQMRSLADI